MPSASRTLTGKTSSPIEDATVWMTLNWPIPEGVPGSRTTAARVTFDATSLRSCGHFALKLYSTHMMVSPSRADLGRSRSKVVLSFSAGLPLQTSHPAGVDPSHCPAFGTGRAPRERHHSV